MSIIKYIEEQKKSLRKLIREKKNAFSEGQFFAESENVFAQLERMPLFRKAKTVLAYWSIPKELQTHAFIERWYKTKTIILPLVVGDILELRVYNGPQCMVEGPAFGILEPQKGEIFSGKSIDFGIIPGMAFDLQGNRMGRGKGYYDKLLKTIDVPKYGVCLSLQVVPQVPTADYDVPMDGVISPK